MNVRNAVMRLFILVYQMKIIIQIGISSSYVRKFGESQLHALELEQETTSAMNFGTAAHSLLVEGEDAFTRDVGVIVGSPYTKVSKELKQDILDRILLY